MGDTMGDIERFRSIVETYSGKEFINDFEKICKQLQEEMKILTFGILIYDDRNSEIKEIINNINHWKALDKSSGSRLVIFTFSDKKEIERGPQLCRYLIGAPQMSNDTGESYSQLIETVFDEKISVAYPSILLFQVIDGSIDEYALIPIIRKEIYITFRDIQQQFGNIAEVLDRIIPECFDNKKEIFKLVKQELSDQKIKHYLFKGPRYLIDILKVIKSL